MQALHFVLHKVGCGVITLERETVKKGLQEKSTLIEGVKMVKYYIGSSHNEERHRKISSSLKTHPAAILKAK